MKRFSLLLASAAAMIAAPLAAETIAITGGKLVIGDGSAPIEGGTVVISNDRVVAAGANVPIPSNARRIDATGKWVTPGVFAGFSRIGLVEVGAVSQTNDMNASGSPFSAALDVQYAINPFASAVAVNRAAGVTRAVVSPSTSGSIFGGYGAIVDLGQDEDAITQARSFQFVELGETGHSRAGGSRSASHVQFRAMLEEARTYARNPAAFDSDLLKASDAKALLPVINGSMINDRDAHQLRYSTQYAGNLVALNKVPRATGLSWNEAFAAISSVPAEIMGMGGKLGSLKSGRQADVVIWDGDPLELSTQVENVLIDGVEQSLSNRQIRLRDRYRNPAPGALPKAYDY